MNIYSNHVAKVFESLYFHKIFLPQRNITFGFEAQMLAELCNWLAKCKNVNFYILKVMFIKQALDLGNIQGAWNSDGTFILASDEVGTSFFHDPHGFLAEILSDEQNSTVVDIPWNGIHRQMHAYEICKDYWIWGTDAPLLAFLRESTYLGAMFRGAEADYHNHLLTELASKV